MSLLSDNVIPGNHGKDFETNATEHTDLLKIKEAMASVSGVKNVNLDENVFPKKFSIHTASVVSVKDIEDAVAKTGFHAIPKSLFEL